ncbi:FKBP-type peptidyl-prolyl cis-trans isomerase [Nonomuraea africana]|uniref:Peptidyl-prolyl cis-trans isomerase n=1 Tax=Nonomuraea africana TaxID=46171 RepID=A0ABR9KQP6_9ACTN|nr:FKBP-type peptidyl-prolyl cis-trans isomerase [Nonomuraea africana]MBE1564090.1 peptidylprolyl isomerase [Nonomuraea africana]
MTVLVSLMLVTSCAAASAPVVSGAFGSRPVIELPSRRPGNTPEISVLAKGTGPRTRQGDVVVAEVVIRGWNGGRTLLNTYDAGRPVTVVFGRDRVPETWERALIGRRIGSRVMLIGPDRLTYGRAGADPDDPLVLVFDILGGYPPDARLVGEKSRALPARPRSGTLIDGSGYQIRPGSRVVVQYVTARWPGREIVESSHARGGPRAFVLKEGAVPSGWVEGLVGKRVGSRVAIAGGSTVTVIDIIDLV